MAFIRMVWTLNKVLFSLLATYPFLVHNKVLFSLLAAYPFLVPNLIVHKSLPFLHRLGCVPWMPIQFSSSCQKNKGTRFVAGSWRLGKPWISMLHGKMPAGSSAYPWHRSHLSRIARKNSTKCFNWCSSRPRHIYNSSNFCTSKPIFLHRRIVYWLAATSAVPASSRCQ